MRKILYVLFALYALCALLFMTLILSINGCPNEKYAMQYKKSAEKDGFYIAINKTENCCFVGEYVCDEYIKNMEITIPDHYEGIPVKRIGGYFGRGVPSPFSISVAGLYMNAPDESEFDSVYTGDIHNLGIEEDYTVEELKFTLNIGKNVDTVANVSMNDYYPHINEDGSITFYHPVVNINCFDINKHFYSKDGKLYIKETDELVSDFAYATP